MNSPTALLMVRWMVSLTFREALASKLFWVTTGFSGLCILLCLSVRVDGPAPLPLERGEVRMRLPAEDYNRLGAKARAEGLDPASSELSILFGAFRVRYRHYPEDAVRFLQFLLAGFIADTAGVLLALVWTAGFLPTFLEPRNLTVLVSKPVPRWSLLLGKYLGVLGFVAVQATFLVVGTWLALLLRTGVGEPRYLLCVPILLVHFAVFFSVTVLLAVWTRSTVVSLVGVLAFWGLCWSTNHAWQTLQGGAPLSVQVGYWVLPKPADLNWLLFDLLGAQQHFGKVFNYPALETPGLLELSLFTSLLFTVGVLALGVRRFARIEY